MMMINSNSLENQLDKHHCHAKPSYDDINNNHQYELDNCDENTMKSDCLSLNDNNNHLHHQNQTTLLTTTTTTTVEVKVKTTKTSSRKRKLNQMNNEQIVQTPTMTTNKKKNSRMTKIESNQANGKTADQSSSTDESAFGSCEPGTNVVLQGIVWNETDKGVLVVNITWRGKTYVGALLNTTEQNWAPPRYKPEIRSTKSISIREQQLTNLPSINESTERILRNGKRRGSSTTVTPNSTTKTRSFKIPETPKTDKLSSQDDDNLNLKTNALVDDDNSSSRSVSPTTSAISTMSSSPPLLISSSSSNQDNLSTTTTTIPIDLSNPTNSLVSYNFPDQILFPSSSSYLPNSSQMYFNSLPSTH